LKAPGQTPLRERADAFCARAILFLMLFILAWGPLAFGGKFPGSFLVIQGAAVAALALWIARFWVQRPFRLFWPPVCWVVLAFLLYAVARCRMVEVEFAGRQQLIRVLVYGALFMVALNNLNRKNSATIVSMALIAVGFVLAIWAVFQFATRYPMVLGVRKMDQYINRGSGTFMNPNHLAGFLGMTLPLALAYTVMGRFSATIKVLLAYAAAAMLAGIVVTVSRGGIVAAGIALAVFCAALLMHRDFWKPALLILCILAALGAGAASQFESVQKRFDKIYLADNGGDERAYYWTAAWQLWARNPAWGVGPGHFDIEFPSVRPWRVQDRPTYTHNDYLNTLCDWGVAGMALIAAAIGLLAWGVFQVWQTRRRPSNELGSQYSDRTAFVAGASAGLLAVMIHCIVEFNMQVPAEAVTAVTLMALLAAQTRFATEGHWKNPGRMGKILLTAAAAAAAAYLSAQGLRKAAETYWLDRANAANTQSEAVIAFATKAHEAEPMNWETDDALGDYLWSLSLDEGPDYLQRAKQAMTWYARAMQLNPFDAYAPTGCGLCLDKLGRTAEATPYFEVAHRNDPHNCYIALEQGRHCVELGDYAAARLWIEDSRKVGATETSVEEAKKLERMLADPLFAKPK